MSIAIGPEQFKSLIKSANALVVTFQTGGAKPVRATPGVVLDTSTGQVWASTVAGTWVALAVDLTNAPF